MTRSAAAAASGLPFGGMSLETFMRRHWQRRPLLVRAAFEHRPAMVERRALLGLAGRDDVESRLVVREASQWRVSHGPFGARALPPRRQGGWTLLVQGVDLHQPAVHRLMQRFRFVPDARLDDCMVSYATEGGGVGPHVDSYDVFLLQVHGRRRWRVGPVTDPRRIDGVPLKILRRFDPTEVWDLEPGDLLYVPPGWGHDGIALDDDCMTCSVGYRAPERHELAVELLQRWLEHLDPADLDSDAAATLYRDPPGAATVHPGAIPASLQRFAEQAVTALLRDRGALRESLALGLGEWLTEPKPRTVFEPPRRAGADPADAGLRLDRRTRLMYDDRCLYINGEALTLPRRDAPSLRRLADARTLEAAAVRRLGRSTLDTARAWVEQGWAHPGTDLGADDAGGPP